MSTPRSTSASSPSRPRSRNKAASPSKTNRTSSTPTKRTSRTKERWSTDEEEEDEVERHPPRTSKQSNPKTRKSRPSLFRTLAFSLVRSFIYPLLPYVLLFSALYLTIAYARYLLYSYLALLPSFLQPSFAKIANISLPLPHLAGFSLTPLASVPCALFGVNCPRNLNLVSGAARKAAYKGQQALTIFDHLLALGNEDTSSGLAMHPVEIWELSTAIRYSSGIEEREFISNELAALGDSVREVKDSVIGLNAQGMNAFIWIVVSSFLQRYVSVARHRKA